MYHCSVRPNSIERLYLQNIVQFWPQKFHQIIISQVQQTIRTRSLVPETLSWGKVDKIVLYVKIIVPVQCFKSKQKLGKFVYLNVDRTSRVVSRVTLSLSDRDLWEGRAKANIIPWTISICISPSSVHCRASVSRYRVSSPGLALHKSRLNTLGWYLLDYFLPDGESEVCFGRHSVRQQQAMGALEPWARPAGLLLTAVRT